MFSTKKGLASILGNFTKTLSELDAFIHANAEETKALTAKMEGIRAQRTEVITEGMRAIKTAENIRSIIGG